MRTATGATPGKRLRKRPRLDRVLAEIDLAEDAGIAGKTPLAGQPGKRQIGKLLRSPDRQAVGRHEYLQV
ncbi:hypothetical protein GGD55_004101 [Rhizobium giardinii]|uniref:Uncharacterized protein n=1 Tax=Rhizobium giardinii TaxID=56731 RepID=A0A7W8UDH8_9HYPH|nr:hypothetical protein [Rhizobium giardinii]